MLTWIKEKQKQWFLHCLNQSPKNLDLEITWRCNLKCDICPRRKGHGQKHELKDKDMSFRRIRQVVQQLASVKTVNLIGAGEPMVHPQFYDVLEYFKQMKLRVKYTTNGTLLTKENVERLPSNVEHIVVSIDSPFTAIYKEMRGTDLLNVINNICYLKRHRPDIRLVLQMLIMQRNLSSTVSMIPIAKEVDASISLIHPICFTKKMDETHIHQPHFQHLAKGFLDNLKVYSARNGIHVNFREADANQHPCVVPLTNMLVSIDGSIYPCCYIYECRGDGEKSFPEWYRGHKVDVPMHRYVLGNVFDGRWDEDRYRSLRRHLLSMRYSTKPLIDMRNEWDEDNGFWDYCDVCLYRWRGAC